MHKLSVLAFLNIFSLAIKLNLDSDALNTFPSSLACNANNIKNLLKFVDAGQHTVNSLELDKFKWTASDILPILGRENLMDRKTDLIPANACVKDEKCRSIIENLLANNKPIPWNFYKDKQSLDLNLFSESSRVHLLQYVLDKHFNEIRWWKGLSCAFLPARRWELWNYVIIKIPHHILCSLDLTPFMDHIDLVNDPDFFLMLTVMAFFDQESNENLPKLRRIAYDSNQFPPAVKSLLQSLYPFDKTNYVELKTQLDNLGSDNTMEKYNSLHLQLTNLYVESLHQLFDISKNFFVKSSILMVSMTLQNLRKQSHMDASLPFFSSTMEKLNNFDFSDKILNSVYPKSFLNVLDQAVKYDLVEFCDFSNYPNVFENLCSDEIVLEFLLYPSGHYEHEDLAEYMDEADGIYYFDTSNEEKVRKALFRIYKNAILAVREAESLTIERPKIDPSFFDALFDSSLRTDDNNLFVTSDQLDTFNSSQFWISIKEEIRKNWIISPIVIYKLFRQRG